MDDHTRFADMINAFVASSVAPVRRAAPAADDTEARPGGHQAVRIAYTRGRLVSFSDEGAGIVDACR